jgi:lipoate-protein ligase A
MAVDEAILEAVQQGKQPPTLRLYAWEPACLSIGYAQSIIEVDEAALAKKGWVLVRRPTGGRAILHVDELTYSVIAPDDEPRLAGGVLESYRRLSGALLKSLERMQVPAIGEEKKTDRHVPVSPNPVCFEVPSDYEITVQGKKLVGSAQARRRKTVLQHGSLPLIGDIARITDALIYAEPGQREEAADRVRARAITVEGAIGRQVGWEEAAAAFGQGFAEALAIDFVEGELSAEELVVVEKWLAEKYAAERWTRRV